MPEKQVCRAKARSRATLSKALSAGWSRVALAIGKGKFADDAEFDVVTINRALTGPSLPSAENLLNSLAADPSALAEVLALYGLQVSPLVATTANDFELAARIGHTLAEFLERLRDGQRCHVDTAVLAPMFRDLIPQMQAIVDQDDARKLGPRVVKG